MLPLFSDGATSPDLPSWLTASTGQNPPPEPLQGAGTLDPQDASQKPSLAENPMSGDSSAESASSSDESSSDADEGAVDESSEESASSVDESSSEDDDESEDHSSAESASSPDESSSESDEEMTPAASTAQVWSSDARLNGVKPLEAISTAAKAASTIREGAGAESKPASEDSSSMSEEPSSSSGDESSSSKGGESSDSLEQGVSGMNPDPPNPQKLGFFSKLDSIFAAGHGSRGVALQALATEGVGNNPSRNCQNSRPTVSTRKPVWDPGVQNPRSLKRPLSAKDRQISAESRGIQAPPVKTSETKMSLTGSLRGMPGFRTQAVAPGEQPQTAATQGTADMPGEGEGYGTLIRSWRQLQPAKNPVFVREGLHVGAVPSQAERQGEGLQERGAAGRQGRGARPLSSTGAAKEEDGSRGGRCILGFVCHLREDDTLLLVVDIPGVDALQDLRDQPVLKALLAQRERYEFEFQILPTSFHSLCI
jgi:hypothetical protein